MLSGRTLFAGETVSETLAAVLRDELQLDDLPPATPPVVRRLLSRCLEREPKLRLRDIGEARIALTPGPHDGEATAAVRRSSPAKRYGILAAGAALALALGLAAGWLAFGPRSAPVVPIHFTFEAAARWQRGAHRVPGRPGMAVRRAVLA